MPGLDLSRLLSASADTAGGASLLEEIADNIMAFTASAQASLDRIEQALAPKLEQTRDEFNFSRSEAIIRRMRVETSGTPVRGPDVPIPPGVVSVIRQRRHSGTPTGYVALNERDVTSTGSRVEMENNDTIVLALSNWNNIWFDADADDTDWELIAEQ